MVFPLEGWRGGYRHGLTIDKLSSKLPRKKEKPLLNAVMEVPEEKSS
jgi:hypothetical protein